MCCVCVWACARVSARVHVCPFLWLSWWMVQEDDQTESRPGLLCDHTGIMGDMELCCIPGLLPVRLIFATLPSHTHRFNCLCFFHYFYCLSSALLVPRACGKVIAMAAVCSQPPSLWLAENGWWADAWWQKFKMVLACNQPYQTQK